MTSRENIIGIINIADKTSINLGRLPDGNDQVLPHPAVSGHHTNLEKKYDGQWWVNDLGSDNGTYVNNRRVGTDGLPIDIEQDTLWIAPYALKLSERSYEIPPRPAQLRLDAVNLVRRVKSRIILDLRGTPLSFWPGEFISIVGGSGAGKSTLLKALLGMDTIPPNGRTGNIYFNNQMLIKDAEVRSFSPLNTIIGYVPQQDDSLHYALTPREALNFTSRMRFASDVDDEERQRRVKYALDTVKLDREELQIKKIANLSGGQRKRVNIAMELVAEPRILFLDEPTSGLDPGLDLEMMRLMKSWADGSQDLDPKTIILITHATENVRLCDYVVFMGLIQNEEDIRGGTLLYFGPPGDTAWRFYGKETFSEVYELVDDPVEAGRYHHKLTTDADWNQAIWEHTRTKADIDESQQIESSTYKQTRERISINFSQLRRQFRILSSRYMLLLRRDLGAFIFQLLQGVLVGLLLITVADRGSFTVSGIRSAPTALFILSIAAAWLGILNATKEIVKEKRVFGRERRYGVGAIPYVLSKFTVLGGLGLWQMGSLVAVTLLWFIPEESYGTLGRALPEALQILGPLAFEWLISLELMLLTGVALGLLISAFSNSLDQANMLMFPSMLIQIVLAGLLFSVGPFAWISISHWGLRALGSSLNLEALFCAAGKCNDPVLDKLNFESNGWLLLSYWLILISLCAIFLALTIWRQSMSDKARIPED